MNQYQRLYVADKERRARKQNHGDRKASQSFSLEALADLTGVTQAAEALLSAMSGGLRGPAVVSFEGCTLYDRAVLIPLSGNCVNVVLQNGRLKRTFSTHKTLPFLGRDGALAHLRKEIVA
jgi:hypothetical protein